MILTSLSDHVTGRRIPISFRIRVAFFLYGLISLAATLYVFLAVNNATTLDLVYEILFPTSVISCAWMVYKPQIGAGSLFLAPLFLGSFVRVLDIWYNYAQSNITLAIATLGSIGWSFLLVSISYIDLLESRIYHRLVNYIEQEAN